MLLISTKSWFMTPGVLVPLIKARRCQTTTLMLEDTFIGKRRFPEKALKDTKGGFDISRLKDASVKA